MERRKRAIHSPGHAMSVSEEEMEPLDVWEGGLDFRLRVEKETKKQAHRALLQKID